MLSLRLRVRALALPKPGEGSIVEVHMALPIIQIPLCNSLWGVALLMLGCGRFKEGPRAGVQAPSAQGALPHIQGRQLDGGSHHHAITPYFSRNQASNALCAP